MVFIAQAVFAKDVKKADLAGRWYPASKAALEKEITRYLDGAKPDRIDGDIFAIIAPHAGYEFSGPVAAYSYKAVMNRGIKTVVVIGCAHRTAFDGMSIYDRGSFETPLGPIKVDTALAAEIKESSPAISFYPEAFSGENSIEMQLAFIQVALGPVEIVPIVFGSQSFDDIMILAEALAKALKNRKDCLVVASTDLSHYHSYEEANRIDARAISSLSTMNAKQLNDEVRSGISEMCSVMSVAAAVSAAGKLGFGKVDILKYANSADTTGDKRHVVGYLSAVIYKEKNGEARQMLNETQRKRLLQIARESIVSYVRDGTQKNFIEKDTLLNENMGAFVTLHEGGELRGCIGNMAGRGPLYKTVASMAIEAATGDQRFSPVSAREIEKLDIEISVLSPLKKVASFNDVKIPGHGVIIRSGFRSGVYLPQVATETGWTRDEFLTSLCSHKAGLPPDAWKDPKTEIYIFTAEVFQEK